LIDKITVLEIKCERMAVKEAAQRVEKELDILRSAAEPVLATSHVAELKSRLCAINRELWDVENFLREKEAAGDFGPSFVSLARSVYKKNDERAELKREINRVLKSELVEEKSYTTTSSGRQE